MLRGHALVCLCVSGTLYKIPTKHHDIPSSFGDSSQGENVAPWHCASPLSAHFNFADLNLADQSKTAQGSFSLLRLFILARHICQQSEGDE